MSGGRSVSFEVYYLQYGRWQIHHRYTLNQRDEAIDEAKRLDTQGHFDAACVVRESYDAETGTSTESVVYHSPRLKTKPPVSFITAGSDGAAKPSKAASAQAGGGLRAPIKNAPEGSAAANAAADAKRRAAAARAAAKGARGKEPELRRPRRASDDVPETDWSAAIPRILLAFILSCVVGTAVGVAAFYGIKGLAAIGLNPGKNTNEIILLAAWFVGWAATFVPALRKILAKARRMAPMTEASSPVPTASTELPVETVSAALDEAVERLHAQQGVEPEPEALQAEDPTPELELPPEPEEPDPPPPPAAAAQEMLGPVPFSAELEMLVDEAKQLSNGQLQEDQFLRFGVILFLSGAAETLARRFKVTGKQATDLLAKRIEGLGVSAEMARGFAGNIDEYLLDPRYFDMYSLGRGGALKRVEDPSADSGMRAAFAMWRKPKPPPGADPDPSEDPKHYDPTPGKDGGQGFVAVLFTDIVESTQKQQDYGDAWLMNVVRAHNDIVREVIAKRNGREIKHTGDGIMASFPNVGDSVDAALSMQDGIGKFSDMMPDLGFEIRIGISAGEPIHESGDLFGTPVNLAARVLSKAKSGETAVSAIVREMCRGKSYPFEEIGRFELKGFDEPQPIFRVVNRRAKARGDGVKVGEIAAAAPMP